MSKRAPKRHHALRYPFIAHGTGLSDEYPVIACAGHHYSDLEPGMVLSAEAYMGDERRMRASSSRKSFW